MNALQEDEKDGGGEDDEDSVNISDVLGDIDDLIVEAEQAMREEQAKAGNPGPHPSQTHPQSDPQTDTQTSTSGWDYDINKVCCPKLKRRFVCLKH